MFVIHLFPPNCFPKVNYFSVTEQKLMMMLMSSLITILYITSVGRASHGNQERHRMIDSDTYTQPEFGPAPNLTRVQVDSTAFLHCNVLNLQEENQVVKSPRVPCWIQERKLLKGLLDPSARLAHNVSGGDRLHH